MLGRLLVRRRLKSRSLVKMEEAVGKVSQLGERISLGSTPKEKSMSRMVATKKVVEGKFIVRIRTRWSEEVRENA